MKIDRVNYVKFKESLGNNEVELSNPNDSGFLLKVNPFINRNTTPNLFGFFMTALKEASV